MVLGNCYVTLVSRDSNSLDGNWFYLYWLLLHLRYKFKCINFILCLLLGINERDILELDSAARVTEPAYPVVALHCLSLVREGLGNYQSHLDCLRTVVQSSHGALVVGYYDSVGGAVLLVKLSQA